MQTKYDSLLYSHDSLLLSSHKLGQIADHSAISWSSQTKYDSLSHDSLLLSSHKLGQIPDHSPIKWSRSTNFVDKGWFWDNGPASGPTLT